MMTLWQWEGIEKLVRELPNHELLRSTLESDNGVEPAVPQCHPIALRVCAGSVGIVGTKGSLETSLRCPTLRYAK